jgi:hypothetical protein
MSSTPYRPPSVVWNAIHDWPGSTGVVVVVDGALVDGSVVVERSVALVGAVVEVSAATVGDGEVVEADVLEHAATSIATMRMVVGFPCIPHTRTGLTDLCIGTRKGPGRGPGLRRSW